MRPWLLYTIALLEGFTTLAVEVIVIRLATPVVGSSIILTSIFLGVILLALSIGYYLGGILASRLSHQTIAWYLGGCLATSGLLYLLVTFSIQVQLLEQLLVMTENYVITLFIVAITLFLVPVVLAAQTIPLLAELVPHQSKGKAAGSMLFFSTIGSFLGSVIPSIILFETIGVRDTATLICLILLIVAVIIIRTVNRLFAGILLGVTVLLGLRRYTESPENPSLIYQFDSAYQDIRIREGSLQGESVRIFHTNGAFSSGIYTTSKKSPFAYIQEAVRITNDLKPATVLVIGTAGFTYPYEIGDLAFVERVDAIDIDPAVYRIAKEYFLQDQLPEAVTFYPESARFFVHQAVNQGKTYDLIFVDAYNGKTIPDELVTKEFFEELKLLASDGTIVFNIIHDSRMQGAFAQNTYTTLNAVFDQVYSKNVSKNIMLDMDNFMVSPTQFDQEYITVTPSGHLYTDNQRTTETDVAMMRWTM